MPANLPCVNHVRTGSASVRGSGGWIMRINGDKPINSASNEVRRRSGEGAQVFRLEQGADTPRASGTGAAAALSGVDALLALQSVGTVGEVAERLRHGHGMLDLLDEIKIGLLSGVLPASKLEQLVESLARRPARIEGDGVEDVLDEIELRARVELAKQGREAA